MTSPSCLYRVHIVAWVFAATGRRPVCMPRVGWYVELHGEEPGLVEEHEAAEVLRELGAPEELSHGLLTFLQ